MQAEILLTLKLQQKLFADPRRISLLKHIALSGSISQGAKDAGISYKSAWDAINAVSYTHLTLPTTIGWCRSRWSPYH